MDPALPFHCPACGLLSVAVGICPDCRLELVARDLALSPPPVPAPAQDAVWQESPPVALHTGLAEDCEEIVRLLQRQDIPVALAKSGEAPGRKGRMTVFEVQVPPEWLEAARKVQTEAWEQEAARQGLNPVTQGEALALEAEGKCPACNDPLLPDASVCTSCGIALA